jgi:hypothetical protein
MENRRQYATFYNQLHQRQKFSSNNWKYFLNRNEHRKRNSSRSSNKCDIFPYCNDGQLQKEMEEPPKMIGYAEDWIIYTSHKLPRVIEARLKKTADKVIECTNENGFRISAEKTKLMFIHKIDQFLVRIRTPRIRIWFNNKGIEMTNHHRFLGMILDQRLNVCLIRNGARKNKPSSEFTK